MINLYIVLGIIFLHWVFDFVLQTEKQAQNKSTDIKALNQHVSVYAGCWIVIFPLIGIDAGLLFISITYVCHFITDYITSRLNTKLAIKARLNEKWHDFFASVGFDQFLHYCQLFLTYYLLTR